MTGVKRRPDVVLSSKAYHETRPDVIVGLVTSRAVPLGPTDYALRDGAEAGLRVASVFRSFLVTPPPSACPTKVGRLSDRDWAEVRSRGLAGPGRGVIPTPLEPSFYRSPSS